MTNNKSALWVLGSSKNRKLGFEGLLMQLVPAKLTPEQGFDAHPPSTALTLSPLGRKGPLWKAQSVLI